ncbi:MAG: exodeoxyribonuclease VII small subunit [Alphaproteobacteria bacterium]|nr:exodeoxyribonuclease VII small subunit [Alphaproteobacteria bacterium]MCY4318523.1 exodeoxyribonuclease VII small subunit [Alphaproteobacteria bacterium]
MAAGTTEIAAMSFEEAMEELERIVQRLEQGRTPLEDAIAAYERGAALKRHCEDKLRLAQEKVEKIALDRNGVPAAEPLESLDPEPTG